MTNVATTDCGAPTNGSSRRRSALLSILVAAGISALLAPAAAQATALGPWLPSPAADLSATGQNASSPQIAVAPDGATTLVWYRSNGSNNIVQAATRAAGATTFSDPVNLSVTGGNAENPQVAVADDGATTVTWTRYNGTNNIIQAATRAAGATTFGDPVNLSATGQSAQSPQIAVAPDGATTIVWYRYNGTNNIVQAATRAAGATTFSNPVDLSATGANASSQQIAVAPDGATTVTWTYSIAGNVVQAATRAAGASTFSSAVNVSTSGANTNTPQIAVAPDGATTITWQLQGGGTQLIQASTRAAGATSFTYPVDLSATGLRAYNPQIAVAADGATTIIWYGYENNNCCTNMVQAVTRAAGATTFSSAVTVSATGVSSYNPQIAVAPDGATTITWYHNYSAIQAVTRAAGASAFGYPVDLTVNNSSNPQIAVAPDGATTITWPRSNGANNIVQAATATPLVTEPSAPTALAATAGNASASVAFTAGASNGAAITNYEYSTDNGTTWTARSPAATTSPIAISGLTNGTAYNVKLRAVNSVGAGAASSAVSVTPVDPTPTPTPSDMVVALPVSATNSVLQSVIVVTAPGTATQFGTFTTSSGARSAKRVTACTGSKTITKAGRHKVNCTLTSAARSARRRGSLRMTLVTTFTPAGGTTSAISRTVTIKKASSGVTG